MGKLRVLDLFSGIGGLTLGLDRTGGFETVAFCEIEQFPQKVLKKHWPEVPIYDDIKELTGQRLAADGITVDVITAGFPCQDISYAGKGAGLAGERSGLFYEVARLIGELEPRFVILENVSALLTRGLSEVLGTLASIGYDAEWNCIPAAHVGAPHRRDRIWIVAYPCCRGIQRQGAVGSLACSQGAGKKNGKERKWVRDAVGRGGEDVANTNSAGLERREETRDTSRLRAQIYEQLARCSEGERKWAVEPDVGRVAHGVPDRTHRLRALGNAVVPQIPEMIGYAILEAIDKQDI